jgi:hypothetical protein
MGHDENGLIPLPNLWELGFKIKWLEEAFCFCRSYIVSLFLFSGSATYKTVLLSLSKCCLFISLPLCRFPLAVDDDLPFALVILREVEKCWCEVVVITTGVWVDKKLKNNTPGWSFNSSLASCWHGTWSVNLEKIGLKYFSWKYNRNELSCVGLFIQKSVFWLTNSVSVYLQIRMFWQI